MTDVYAWFDPHEEREERERVTGQLRWARQQIDHARTEGAEEVLSVIVEREKSAFWRTMSEALGYLATRVAEEVVFPQVRNNYPAALEAKRRVEQELHHLNLQVLAPMICAPSPIGIQAYMAPANEQAETGPRIVFQMPAFSFTQQLPPTREFR